MRTLFGLMLLIVGFGSSQADGQTLLRELPPSLPVQEEKSTSENVPDKGPPILRLVDANPIVGPPPRVCADCDLQNPDVLDETLYSLSAEFVSWRFRRVPINVPLLQSRIVGFPGLGPTDLHPGLYSGIRFGGSVWFSPKHRWGIEGSAFFFEQLSTFDHRASDGDGSPQLERPFVDSRTLTPIFIPVSIPNQLSGSLTLSTTTRLGSGEASIIGRLLESSSGEVPFEGLVGYRFTELRESLTIRQTSYVLPTIDPTITVDVGSLGTLGAGGGQLISDRFRVSNQFSGAQLGLRSRVRYNSFFVNTTVKGAVGRNRQSVDAFGETVVLPGTTTTRLFAGGVSGQIAPMGLFAGPSNFGTTIRNETSYIAEGSINLGCMLSEHLTVFVGYTGFYWTNVARPGMQLDPGLNPNQLRINQQFQPLSVGNRPTIPFQKSDFWAHGWNLGFEVAF